MRIGLKMYVIIKGAKFYSLLWKCVHDNPHVPGISTRVSLRSKKQDISMVVVLLLL